jgi:hypothetical protein
LTNGTSIRKSWGFIKAIKVTPESFDDMRCLVWIVELARE